MHIRIVSPSATINSEYIDKAAQVLLSWGHEVSIAAHAKGKYGGAAGTPEQRLQDLNDAFADPAVDAILCSRGGYGLVQIIDKVEPKENKLLIGFSDITCLHCLCASHGMPSLHAIMAKHIATLDESSEPMKALRSALNGDDLEYVLPTTKAVRQGSASGMLRGGNLSVFYGLQRTPIEVIDEGSILFIEDIDEPHYHIDRMMNNLRLSGVLRNVQGLILGQFTDCADDEQRLSCTLQTTFERSVKDYNYPVVSNFPAGHVDYNMPMFMNSMCQLTVEEDKTIFKQANPIKSFVR